MDKECILKALDAVMSGSKIYFFSNRANLCYSYDLNNSETELVGCLPDEEPFAYDLIGQIFVWHEQLFFIPYSAKKMWTFDLTNNKWESVYIDNIPLRSKRKFWGAIEYQDKLILIGGEFLGLLVVDMAKKEVIQSISEPFDYLSDISPDECCFNPFGVVVEDNLYLASYKTNIIMKLNLQTYKNEFLLVGNNSNTYTGITFDGNDFWLASYTSKWVVRWDGKDKVEEFEIPEGCYEYGKYNFCGIHYYANNVFLPAYAAERSIYIRRCDEWVYEKEKYMYVKCGKNYLLGGMCDGNVKLVDLSHNKHTNILCKINHSKALGYIREKCEYLKNSNAISYEDTLLDLNLFLKLLK